MDTPTILKKKIDPRTEIRAQILEEEVKELKTENKRLEKVIDNFKKMHSGWAGYRQQLGL
tara:strand:+ start:659 stop:838 length:180 start_codon:yes stop_codon:yes gene_type:complete